MIVHDEDPNWFFNAVHVFARLLSSHYEHANGVGCHVREFRFDSVTRDAAHEVLDLIGKSPNRRRTPDAA
jgi:hypothetical protein